MYVNERLALSKILGAFCFNVFGKKIFLQILF